MLKSLKQWLYFPLASYFRFFAQIQLALWKPRIIVITGSSGKTTLLHLVESQLGKEARYSHHANSAYGICFDILGLKIIDFTFVEWLSLFLLAPLKAFKKPFLEKIYIVEADCDRPGEGKFLSTLLHPEVTLWLNATRTHSLNFDNLVKQKKFTDVNEAIAFEFGYFIENCKDLAIVNSDSHEIVNQLSRTRAKIEKINKSQLQKYQITKDETEFIINKQKYGFKCMLPEDVFYSLAMCISLAKFMDRKIDNSFADFKIPPGRSSIFKGVKNTTLIDSTYNANLSSMSTVLAMFDKLPGNNKWLILGDMLEQGNQEKQEHEKLAEIISGLKVKKIILFGKAMLTYTYPKLKEKPQTKTIVETFTSLTDILNYLTANIKGQEILLFKGSKSIPLEGIIEHLLENKKDLPFLCKREKIWQLRRTQAGL
ncbi:MAG TPA: cyanophycin synthetase [Patescibacteria group bacterium]|nr:cyanophycin synthetase [Patescibacteria group bacterium]